MIRPAHFVAIAALSTLAVTSQAVAQNGPVATACREDIAQYCADKQHGQGNVRACLEANRDKLSKACKAALDRTGPGRGPRSQNGGQ